MDIQNKSLRGKRALVTGATSGIGWQIARQLAGRGVNLVLTCRRGELLEQRRTEISQNFNVDCRTITADLATAEGVENFLAAIRDIEIDILVNDAGSISYGAFQELPWSNESGQVHLLAIAPIKLIHALLPGMLERGFGRILNIASVAGLMPGPYFATYHASKAFLISFSDSLAGELRGLPVTCGCLLPGTTRTDFWKVDGLRGKIGDREKSFMPPEKVANIALRMIEKGETFRIVGLSNKIKQFILRRLAPRNMTLDVLTDHCLSEHVVMPKSTPQDYTQKIIGADEFIPHGLCPYLAHSIIPYIVTLSGGGKFPWMELDDPAAVDVQCPNPGGAVTVRIKRKDNAFNIDIRGLRGNCPKGYKCGESFTWAANPAFSWTDLNVALARHISGTPDDSCPQKAKFQMSLLYCTHRCRYHKWPRRDHYDESNWIPDGLCPELFHAAYPNCLAMIYGGGSAAQSVISCPHSGKARLKIEVVDRPTIGLRKMAQKALRMVGMNTEIPLQRCFLHVIEAGDDCPYGMKSQMKFEFNMGNLRGICPAMFHNAYPVIAAQLQGAPLPWPELAGCRGALQCPDSVSNITMGMRLGSGS